MKTCEPSRTLSFNVLKKAPSNSVLSCEKMFFFRDASSMAVVMGTLERWSVHPEISQQPLMSSYTWAHIQKNIINFEIWDHFWNINIGPDTAFSQTRGLVCGTRPHLVGKPSCPLTLIWLRSWAKAESVCFFRCFPYGPGPESQFCVGSLCLAWELELRVILVTGGWGAFLSQLDLDLFIPTPVDSRKKNPNHSA